MIMQWCRRRGCKRTSKGFDLLKIRAKSQKIRVKMVPNVCRKSTGRLCFWKSHWKKPLWSLWDKFWRQKSSKIFFLASLGKLGQKFFASPNICLLQDLCALLQFFKGGAWLVLSTILLDDVSCMYGRKRSLKPVTDLFLNFLHTPLTYTYLLLSVAHKFKILCNAGPGYISLSLKI